MSERFSVKTAGEFKDAFHKEFKPGEGLTRCTIYELEKLEKYVEEMKNYLDDVFSQDGNNGEIMGIAAYSAFSTEEITGSDGITVEKDKLVTFLAPVLFKQKSGHLEQSSFRSFFREDGHGIELPNLDGTGLYAFDISHLEP